MNVCQASLEDSVKPTLTSAILHHAKILEFVRMGETVSLASVKTDFTENFVKKKSMNALVIHAVVITLLVSMVKVHSFVHAIVIMSMVLCVKTRVNHWGRWWNHDLRRNLSRLGLLPRV